MTENGVLIRQRVLNSDDFVEPLFEIGKNSTLLAVHEDLIVTVAERYRDHTVLNWWQNWAQILEE